MSIQDNINQTLRIGTALFSQTDVAAANKEKADIRRKQKSLTKSAKALSETATAAVVETETSEAQYAQSINDVIARKYELALQSGDIKGVNEALGLMSELEDVNATYANTRANVKVNSKQQQKDRMRGTKNGNN